MRYRTIGQDPATSRSVSVLGLGTLPYGSTVDDDTSFAILDRFAEAGGTFLDTSNNYAFWVNTTQGGESEALIGRWRQSRGVGSDMVIATKLGARPVQAGLSFAELAQPQNVEGLSARVIRESAERSRDALGVEKIDLLYAHVQDQRVPLDETVAGFADLVDDGTVALLGASNHWSWRIEQARALAAAGGRPGYEVLQHHYSYLRARTDQPGRRFKDGSEGVASGDLLTYLRFTPGLVLCAYSPLLSGAYVRDDRPLEDDFAIAGNTNRLAALREVAAETGASANQVVLAWMMGGDLPVIPLIGASSVAQLEDSLGAVDLELTEGQRAKLDAAN